MVGGGMCGMYVAYQLAKHRPDTVVTLLEQSEQLGGTYGSIWDEHGDAHDFGMHLFYEACDERVDAPLREILPLEDWHIWPGIQKDVAGLYWQGRLQTNSHYLDLRSLPDAVRESLRQSLFDAVHSNANWQGAASAGEYLTNKFGADLAERYFAPVLQHLWHARPDELAPYALRMVSMDRVIWSDHDEWVDGSSDERYRAAIAIPDQRKLPPGVRTSPQRALYPKRYGFGHYIKQFEAKLVDLGVKVVRLAKISGLSVQADQRIVVDWSALGESKQVTADWLYWAVSPFALLKSLDASSVLPSADMPHHLGFAHFHLRHAPKMEDLYYFYCYDPGLNVFRVTNFSAYCATAATEQGYPVCVEMHYPSDAAAPTVEQCLADAKRALVKLGVTTEEDIVATGPGHIHPFGFPRPTLKNQQAFAEVRSRLNDAGSKRIVLGGVAPDQGRFFLHEILLAAANDVERIINE
ncbi:MAG: NAD(P)-binding protein [Burkholderiales bacterium]|nr:NAD(P)-binding protein [Burkholderiales bacterium]